MVLNLYLYTIESILKFSVYYFNDEYKISDLDLFNQIFLLYKLDCNDLEHIYIVLLEVLFGSWSYHWLNSILSNVYKISIELYFILSDNIIIFQYFFVILLIELCKNHLSNLYKL